MTKAKSSPFEELSESYRAKMEDCKSLLEEETVKTVPFLQEDLETLLNLSELALTILQEDIEIIGNYGSSQTTIDKWNKSRFSPNALTHHLSVIKENVSKLEGYIEYAKAEGVELKLGETLQHYLGSPKDVMLAFTFNEGAFKSEDLQHAYRCLGDDDFVTKSPFDPKVEDPIKSIYERSNGPDGLGLLVLYSKENRKEPNRKYVVSSGSNCPDNSIAYTSIFTSDGEEHFELPGKPSKPLYIENTKTANSLKIKLTPSDVGEQNVTGFNVSVFEVGSLIKTIEVPKLDAGSTEFLVEDLLQGMEYSFKVQSISVAGLSPKSAMSEKIIIDRGVTYKTSRSIRLSSSS
jgi:hypothetical protein